jgi:hypothetical protein
MIKAILDIINDTLKKKTSEGTIRWSRTSLSMLSAWVTALAMGIADYIQHGLNFEVFLVLVSAALSYKGVDGIVNRLNK